MKLVILLRRRRRGRLDTRVILRHQWSSPRDSFLEAGAEQQRLDFVKSLQCIRDFGHEIFCRLVRRITLP